MNIPTTTRAGHGRRGTAAKVACGVAAIIVAPLAAQASQAAASPASTTASSSLVKTIAPLVNLKPADLQGWRHVASPNLGQSSNFQIAACAGTFSPAKVGFAGSLSDVFTNASSQEVLSVFEAVNTPAEMATLLRAQQGARLIQCVRKLEIPALTRALPRGVKVSLSHYSVPGMPAQSYGYRVQVTLSEASLHLHIDADALGVVVGRAEVGLDVSSSQGALPASLEKHLFQVLAHRLAAHRAALE